MIIPLTCQRPFYFLLLLLLVLPQHVYPLYASSAHQSHYQARIEDCFWKIFNDRKADFSGEGNAPSEVNISTPLNQLRTSQLPVAQIQNIFHTTPYIVGAGTTKLLN